MTQISRNSLRWQFIAVVLVLLPHLTHLPLWVPFAVLLCGVWRLMVYLGRWSFPNKWIKTLLVIGAGVGVLASFKSGGGISVTVALLVIGFGLKLLEMYQRRDAIVVNYVALLVISAAFLFEQSILMAIYVLVAMWVVFSALVSSYIVRETPFFLPGKKALLFVVPALPLMLVLFIGVPRTGPLWEVGLDRSAGKTGLSEQMSPGDISRLTRSAETAFRVEFDELPPAQNQLYWRALVLNDFDGITWVNRKADSQQPVTLEPLEVAQQFVNYKLVLEPTQQRYVPALETPVSWANDLKPLQGYSLTSIKPITDRKQIRLTSALISRRESQGAVLDYERQLVLPEGNPKARALAQQWLREGGGPKVYLNKLLKRFNQEFNYSLTPPRLGSARIDEFLFESKTGFCEHFSSTTAFMLRAAGIPARIVAGYQGGEWNPYEKYIEVRQYDAHAWVEAWFEGEGWVRIDPTAWVAPERVEQPADVSFSDQQSFLEDTPLLALGLRSGALLADLRLRIDALNYGWHRWVLNYHNSQASVLKSLLGAATPERMALFLLLPFVFIIALVSLGYIRRNKVVRHLHASEQEIERLSKAYAALGLSRSRGETVTAYCQRLAAEDAKQAELLLAIAQNFERIRYADIDLPENNKLLRSQITRLLSGVSQFKAGVNPLS